MHSQKYSKFYAKIYLTLRRPAGYTLEGGLVAEGVCWVRAVGVGDALRDAGAGGCAEGGAGAKRGRTLLAGGAADALASRAQRSRVGIAKATTV